jgi:hypothetical protein
LIARGVWARAWVAIAVSICMRGAFAQHNIDNKARGL